MDSFASYQNCVNFDNMFKIYDVSRHNTSEEIFRFMDGPPFVTGNLHMGHLAIGTIKSSILNYKNMRGNICLNKLGYDCHGVPIESIVNRELNITTLEQRKQIGLYQFNQHCKDAIHRFEGDWKPIYEHIGRWANFDNTYKTMDKDFMESVWWGFAELYKKGLIYRSYKITPYSYALQTPLSNSEASEGMKEIDTRSIYVRFRLNDSNTQNTYFVAWTTTPWTLPSNIALCVNSTLEYEYVEDETGDIYILGKDKHKNCNLKVKSIIKTVIGSDLIGMKYIPLFPYFNSDKYHMIIADNYVTDSGITGTDIVHIAPMFGEDDMRVCITNNIITRDDMPNLETIDDNCKYLPKITNYNNILVFDAETQIIKDLKEQKHVLRTQQIKHSYPHCYRTDTPLVYKACESFYVDVQKIKQRMCELNSQINWIPVNIGSERFYNWISNAKDWCISRTRYFGNPIPAWIANDGTLKIIGSIAELEELSQQKFDDIHPEYVNNITFTIDGKIYTKIQDVFDCWFESGSVPFAQYHYPFENGNIFDNTTSMSSFICEGIDQTRGWFYSLHILSVGLFDKIPADNILVVGHILDENKKKFSKKTKNYVDPNILIDRYGSDAIRLYLLQSPVTRADCLAFKEEDIKFLNKDLFQFQNCIDFLKEHTENQKRHNIVFDKKAYSHNIENPMDIWIMHHIQNSGAQVIKYMDVYNVSKAVRIIIDLIEDITNWYLKLNRDRLKGKCGNDEWIKSTSVLTYVITSYVQMLSPFAPFIAEKIYRELEHLHEDKEMIHKTHYNFLPATDTTYIETFDLLKRISRLVRSARMNTKTHTSTKTPIKFCEICMDSEYKINLIKGCIELIQSELNVLDIKYSHLSGNIKYKYVPNKAVLGKKYKKFASEIYKFFEKSDLECNSDGNIILYIDTQIYKITQNEYTKEPSFNKDDIFDGDILIKIDFTYDLQIEKMSHLKRFISHIQHTRKIMGLHPWDKISIEINNDEFDIVLDNVEYMKKRLECEINPNSNLPGNIIYEDENMGKKIYYSVKCY